MTDLFVLKLQYIEINARGEKKTIIYPSLSVLLLHSHALYFLKIPKQKQNNCLYILLDRNPTTIQNAHHTSKSKQKSNPATYAERERNSKKEN
jgi:hypothetical protein